MDAKGREVVGFPNLSAWLKSALSKQTSLIVLLDQPYNTYDLARSIKLIRSVEGPPRIAAITREKSREAASAALAIGVSGYISDHTDVSNVAIELEFVAAGGTFVSPDISLAAESRSSRAAHAPEQKALTPQELLIISKLASGKSNNGIAIELNISPATVKVHIRNIMKKLGTKNRTEVAILANEIIGASVTRASDGGYGEPRPEPSSIDPVACT
ncbi:hypothetical protein GCM10010994_12910 [Chelatococcus reniformis]|uniref:HTH luxR-type domain-containing protein n=1 Tax=Chelatococcus reniformis TaxID=1494448 RepID=A0A916U1C5_9HYPH|nr:hypothetical protein GCM10010994_12910 [Chelatococcus reniformis]